ncbi:MAG: succinylglutamate desuccinylase/aspartoacylase family protein [Deltaproteobacteria bacterium]|nr:succinylglutamate desuccinylase/aspartoacylase family protein [Deltaproteobacteria bacterium]
MSPGHTSPNPDIPGVTYLSRDPALPRPHVGVLGSVHGDEECGVEAIRDLLRRGEAGELALGVGTMVLIHGNPEASALGIRSTEGGADINRILDFDWVRTLPEDQWTSEHRRAFALRPVLEDVDVLLDLHSASNETPAFGIVNAVPKSLEIAKRLGVGFVVHSWGELSPKVTIGVLQRRQMPGISVECGQHHDPQTNARALAITERFLRYVGALEGIEPALTEVIELEVEEILKKPSRAFRFARPLSGMERLDAGELVGTDGTIDFRLEKTRWAILPNEGAAVGGDLLYLAKETG